MRTVLLTLGLSFFLSLGVSALGKGDLPTETAWYLHVDLTQMRSTVTGEHLMSWMADEVFDEVELETGIDLQENLDGVTVFGNGDDGDDGAVLLHGSLNGNLQDEILGFLESFSNDVEKESLGSTEIYAFSDIEMKKRKRKRRLRFKSDDEININIDTDENAFIGFGQQGQTIITQNRSLLESWSAAGGRFTNRSDHNGALLVLEADRSLIQGGVRREIGHGGPWNSSIGKNMEQIALILFDEAGLAALDINILTSTPKTAESLHDVVRGLLSLKSLTLDDEPELSALLDDTNVDVAGSQVTISSRFSPKALIDVFD